MAKMYYTLEEAIDKLGCTEDQLRGFVRSGQLREFRDAGKVNYRVDDVNALASRTGDNLTLDDTGELALDDSGGDVSPTSDDKTQKDKGKSGSGSGAAMSGSASALGLGGSGSGSAPGLSGTGMSLEGTDAPIDLGSSGSGEISLEGSSGELSLEDSGSQPAAPPKGPPKKAREGEDVLTLDEVDKNVVEGMKKDDTVITNIGISVFDEEDLEIAADPMAKTVMTSEADGLGLDGSSAGSGLLDLTRESDDTSLGAELLEGIDMGDTAETVMKTVSDQGGAAAPTAGEEEGLPEAEMAPAVVGPGSFMVAAVPAASPAFTGLLIAGMISMALMAAAAIAMTMQAWPAYLATLADQFWFLLGGVALTGAVGAGVGYLVGRPPSAPKPKTPKDKGKKGKKGAAEPVAPETPPGLDEGEPLT